jgi:hypothetical protein
VRAQFRHRVQHACYSDAAVAAFAAQRFWLSWPDTDRLRSRAPDFLARTTAGVGVIVDCRPAEQITR